MGDQEEPTHEPLVERSHTRSVHQPKDDFCKARALARGHGVPGWRDTVTLFVQVGEGAQGPCGGSSWKVDSVGCPIRPFDASGERLGGDWGSGAFCCSSSAGASAEISW